MNHLEEKYELVVGLEVHIQLLTKSKLFCGDSAAFGGAPNTHISPITLAHPGTLPRVNQQAVEYAIRLGLACNCTITRYNYFARKNYFYPDLPKGYQLSQHTTPICTGGYIPVNTSEGQFSIPLNRIHLEEDAGKSLHDIDPEFTCVDLNRAGVPLLEMVTEPAIHSAAAAYAYLTEVRKLVRYLGICDGNMEEGSMRCDANISVRPRGQSELGTKVEIKNLNSIRNVKRAIELEAGRLMQMAEQGETILQETRSYDATNHSSFALRTKEAANDYRYFADPDLPPFQVSELQLETIRAALPELPEPKIKRFQEQYRLSEADARLLAEEQELAAFFEAVLTINPSIKPKSATNWILGPIKSYLNERHLTMAAFPLPAQTIAELILLIDAGTLNFSTASGGVFAALLNSPESGAAEMAAKLNLIQDSNSATIAAWVDQVLQSMPDKVAEYKKGKKGLIGLFVGEVKKRSAGKADPKITNDLLIKKLQS